jgi:hypothetical protein
MNSNERILATFAFMLIIGGLLLNSKSCTDKIIFENPGNVQSANVITDPVELDKLPKLPNNEKPTIAIPVPTPKPKPGKIVATDVIISDMGNTYIGYTEKIEIGFKCQPKICAGISTDFLLGLDISFFTYWRFNADALIYAPIRQDLDFSYSRGSLGVSFQITNNSSVGVGYCIDAANRRSWAAFLAFKL